MRKGFLIIMIIVFRDFYSYGQLNNQNKGLSQKQGIIVFEGQNNVFDMYFIKTPFKDLPSLFKNKKDTITAYILYTANDDNNVGNYKCYLNRNIHFDSLSLLISQENYQGLQYEDTSKIYYKYGSIKYVESKSYRLAKRYKKLYFNDKTVIIALEDYLPIEAFTPKVSGKKVRKINNISDRYKKLNKAG